MEDKKEFRLLGEGLGVGLKRFCKFWSLILEIHTFREVTRERERENESFFCINFSWLFVGLLMMIHNRYRIHSLRSLKFFFSKRKRSSPKDRDLKPWGCLVV